MGVEPIKSSKANPLHSAGAATREQPELRAKDRYADPSPGGWVGMQVKIA